MDLQEFTASFRDPTNDNFVTSAYVYKCMRGTNQTITIHAKEKELDTYKMTKKKKKRVNYQENFFSFFPVFG